MKIQIPQLLGLPQSLTSTTKPTRQWRIYGRISLRQMTSRNISINKRSGTNHTMISYSNPFQNNATHADVTIIPDDNRRARHIMPEPPSFRRILMLLAVIYNCIRSNNGIASDAYFIGTQNLTTT